MNFVKKNELPLYLRSHISEQDYKKYTAKDQAVWRFILRQFKSFLPKYAYKCYLKGLKETGIFEDHIPKISDISQKLEKYGWKAVPVSGLIPPSVFMEFQALGYLPINSDIRTLDNLTFTPTPDIIHEAAGHAPILVDLDFAQYLKSYAQVAHKAIINRDDLDLYQAMRHLADIKEFPMGFEKEIQKAEEDLKKRRLQIKEPSEAALLARLFWWTAEQGLIGDIQSPKIYGANLLSAIGEAQTAFTSKIKKIPFSLNCIDYAFDTTEYQPQLFVTKSFKDITQSIGEMAKSMAFARGGSYGLNLAQKSKVVNTIKYNSGLEVAGVLSDYKENSSGPIYIHTQGPTQLCYKGQVISGHEKTKHLRGFSSPIGQLKNFHKCLSEASLLDLESLGFKRNKKGEYEKTTVQLCFQSGIVVEGRPISILRASEDDKLLIITFSNCKVTYQGDALFDPSYGEFDMAVGSSIDSVFSGPSDQISYGQTDEFSNPKRPVARSLSEDEKELICLYQEVRDLRSKWDTYKNSSSFIGNILALLDKKFSTDWLLRLEVLELSYQMQFVPTWQDTLKQQLISLTEIHKKHAYLIHNGIRISHCRKI